MVTLLALLFFFLMLRRPPRSTLFPTRRSSDLANMREVRWPLQATAGCVRYFMSDFGGQSSLTSPVEVQTRGILFDLDGVLVDRKSTRLNSSHMSISYAVFCLKKKKNNIVDNS